MSAPPPSLLSEDDYEAIEAAVMETGRGRWFLSEFARRNRSSDTRAVLDAISKLESVVQTTQTAPREQVRDQLVDMSSAIERTRQEIAQLAADTQAAGRFVAAGEEFETVVASGETATREILGAAEKVQEVAWHLRDSGADPDLCDLIDQRATDIYMACSFHEQAGQRIASVIQTLRYLDGRINAMMDLLGQPTIVATAPAGSVAGANARLIDRPARHEPAPSPAMIEAAIEEELFGASPAPEPAPEPPRAPAPAPRAEEARAPAPTPAPRPIDRAAPEAPAPRMAPAITMTPGVTMAAAAAIPAETPTAPPLASRRVLPLLPDLAELSFAEKMALFS